MRKRGEGEGVDWRHMMWERVRVWVGDEEGERYLGTGKRG